MYRYLHFLTLLLGISPGLLVAQGNYTAFGNKQDLERVSRMELPAQNNRELLRAEMAKRKRGRAPEFAKTLDVHIDPTADGNWEQVSAKEWIWRQRIFSKGAYSLNLGFTDFYLPPASILLLYTPEGKEVYGPFTPADNETYSALWTPVIPGDELVIELRVTASEKDNVRLTLSHINHDFLGLNGVLSGSCNLDVVCNAENGWEEVDAYRDVIQSVGMYTLEGKKLCSGFLVNNSNEDCTPYFMTARHCSVSLDNARSMVVYWNYQNSFCRKPGTIDGNRSGDGNFKVFNTGAVFVSAYRASDFTLVKLDDPVKEEAHAFFAGWNRSNEVPRGGVACVHHPSTEEKRFSYDDDPTFVGVWGENAQANPDGDHLIISNWEIGTTEDGSSGAPLFNENREVVGQLHGGKASCINRDFDAFGWFYRSWEGGGAPGNRLKDWLDPNQISDLTMPGRWNSQCVASIQTPLAQKSLCGKGKQEYDLLVSEAFGGIVQLSIDYLPSVLKSHFSSTDLQPGGTSKLSVVADEETPSGNYPIVVRATDGIDTAYTTFSLQVNKQPSTFRLLSPTPDEIDIARNAAFSWTASEEAQDYWLTVARDSSFEDLVFRNLLKDTFGLVKNLDYRTQYYWKVDARNQCGELTEVAAAPFITIPNISLSIIDHPTQDCMSDSIEFVLQLGEGFQAPTQIDYSIQPAADLDIRYDFYQDDSGLGTILKVTLKTLGTLPPDLYTISFNASDGAYTGKVSTSFTIKDTPLPTQLLHPADQAIIISGSLHFQWDLNEDALDYILEIAGDTLFENVITTPPLKRRSYETKLDGGHYYWRVVAVNDCGATVSPFSQFTVKTNNIASLNEVFAVFEPNPTSGVVNIRLSDSLQRGTYQVLNFSGQLVQESQVPDGETFIQVFLGNLPNGVYLIRLKERQSSITRKIILQH